jgi:hypothetical protein
MPPKKDLVRGREVRRSDVYDDTLPSGSGLEVNPVDLENDLNGIRSQLKRLIHGINPGNWYDAPAGADDSFLSTTLPNGDSVTLVPGMPVINISGMFKRGNATSLGTALIVGLVVLGNTPTNPVTVITTGNLVMTTAQWDAITGDVGGLIPGLLYFLGLSLGALTTSAPLLDGQSVTQVGEALTSTIMAVLPRRPILL